MLKARIPAHDGKPETFVSADDEGFEKADFYDLAAQGLLRCSGTGHDGLPCSATVTHVKGGFVDGGIAERSPHFRVMDAESHSKGCDNIDDPRASKRAATIREALSRGHPVLVNINFMRAGVKNGAKILGPEFNANVDNPAASLWKKAAWERHVKTVHGISQDDIVTAPARDITDVLYYLELAKQWGEATGGREGAQRAMNLLWFNTGHMIQPCSRFVINGSEGKMGALVRQFVERARETPKGSSELFDTPRLFMFTVSEKQVEKAAREASHDIYGQQLDVDISMTGGDPIMHRVALAMRMRSDSGLDNRSVLKAGRTLWVVAVPTLGRFRAYQIKHKGLGKAIPQPKAASRFSRASGGTPKAVTAQNLGPAFVYLQIGCPEQMVSPDAPRRKPAPERTVSRKLVAA